MVLGTALFWCACLCCWRCQPPNTFSQSCHTITNVPHRYTATSVNANVVYSLLLQSFVSLYFRSRHFIYFLLAAALNNTQQHAACRMHTSNYDLAQRNTVWQLEPCAASLHTYVPYIHKCVRATGDAASALFILERQYLFAQFLLGVVA